MSNGGRESNEGLSLIIFQKGKGLTEASKQLKKVLKPLKDGWGKGTVKIANGEWSSSGLEGIAQQISEWHIKKCLTLCYNFRPSLLKEIRHIYFPLLQQLELGKNMIESVECLWGLFTPNLEILNLSFNNVTVISSVRKWNFPGLTHLHLYFNSFSQVDALCELNSPKLTTLSVAKNLYQNKWMSLLKISSNSVVKLKANALCKEQEESTSDKARKVLKSRWSKFKQWN